ncbi:MAG: aminotransferase class IV [Phycisphaerales bacterium]
MLIWLNGNILPAEEARISPFDRGFLFGDGVYEVVPWFNRLPVGADLHARRLCQSLAALGFDERAAPDMNAIGAALFDAAEVENGLVYVQVTRGTEIPRRHLPAADLEPTVFAFLTPLPALSAMQVNPIRALTRPDQRWQMCWTKSTNLLGNILPLMQAARELDSPCEVILCRDGCVSEGAMTNVIAVLGDGSIVTPPTAGNPPILPGVTRALLLEAARDAQYNVREQAISLDELRQARELMVTSSRRLIDAVVELDGVRVGDGKCGQITLQLFELLRERIAAASSSRVQSAR